MASQVCEAGTSRWVWSGNEFGRFIPKTPLKKSKKKKQKCGLQPVQAIRKYCSISTLHGVRNIAADDSSLVERIVWGLIVVVSGVMTVSMMTSVVQKYQNAPTMTSIESNHHPIVNIPFPAVTVCNTNVILRSSALNIIEKLVKYGIEREIAAQFLKELPQGMNGLRPPKIKNGSSIMRAMHLLNYTLESLLYEVGQPCGRLLERCYWMGDLLDCKDMFVHLATSFGYCCSFNWHGRETEILSQLRIRRKSTEDWKKKGIFEKIIHVEEMGSEMAGLSLVVNTEMEDYYASINAYLGAVIVIHHPERFPDFGTPGVYLQPKFEMNIRLIGQLVESSAKLRDLKPNQRQCYFQDEVTSKTGKWYSYESCVLDRKMATYLQKCGCMPFHFPFRSNDTAICDLNHWDCLYHYKDVSSGQESTENGTDDCLPSCTDVSYDFTALSNKIYTEEYGSPDFDGHLGNRSRFNVFFRDSVCIKYRRVSQMSWETMLASVGGIVGLYLGGSLLSIVELLYYLIFKLWSSAPNHTVVIQKPIKY